jgi:MFS family permease
MFFVGLVAGRLARRIGGRIVVISGCLIGALSLAMLAFTHDEKWELYLATAIMGIGFGLAFAAMSGLIVNAVPAEQTGVASGMNANIRTIGGSIGSAVMAGLVTAQTGATGLPLERGYVIGFVVLAGGMVVAATAACVMPDIHDQPTHDRFEDADNAGLGMVAGGPALTERHDTPRS